MSSLDTAGLESSWTTDQQPRAFVRATMEVVEGGPFTTVQDLPGRVG